MQVVVPETVAQWDERRSDEPKVWGSTPTLCFTLKLYFEERRR